MNNKDQGRVHNTGLLLDFWSSEPVRQIELTTKGATKLCGRGSNLWAPVRERALARLVGVRQRKPPGRGFDPRLAQEKKLSRLSHVQSTVEPGLTHKATAPRVRVGQGFGGFLGLLWEGHSTSQTMPWGRSYPRWSRFFFNEPGQLISIVFNEASW